MTKNIIIIGIVLIAGIGIYAATNRDNDTMMNDDLQMAVPAVSGIDEMMVNEGTSTEMMDNNAMTK